MSNRALYGEVKILMLLHQSIQNVHDILNELKAGGGILDDAGRRSALADGDTALAGLKYWYEAFEGPRKWENHYVPRGAKVPGGSQYLEKTGGLQDG